MGICRHAHRILAAADIHVGAGIRTSRVKLVADGTVVALRSQVVGAALAYAISSRAEHADGVAGARGRHRAPVQAKRRLFVPGRTLVTKTSSKTDRAARAHAGGISTRDAQTPTVATHRGVRANIDARGKTSVAVFTALAVLTGNTRRDAGTLAVAGHTGHVRRLLQCARDVWNGASIHAVGKARVA